MPERSPDRPQTPPPADATRDIRLPPLPDRPAPAVPPEWSSYLPSAPVASGRPPADGATAAAPPAEQALQQRSVDEPTDRLSSPSDSAVRQKTQLFSPPPSVQLLKVSVTPRRRTTTKVLWTLVILTLAVIIACGIYLLVVVNQR